MMPYLKNKGICYPLISGHKWAGKVVKVGNKKKMSKKEIGYPVNFI